MSSFFARATRTQELFRIKILGSARCMRAVRNRSLRAAEMRMKDED